MAKKKVATKKRRTVKKKATRVGEEITNIVAEKTAEYMKSTRGRMELKEEIIGRVKTGHRRAG